VKNSLLCEVFVVEGKMILVGSFKSSFFPLKRGTEFIRSSKMAKKAQPKCRVRLLTPPGRQICMADPTGQILGSKHPIDLAPHRGFALRQSA
jgi:hypothetical protein